MLDDQLKRALDRRRERGILRGLKSYEVVGEDGAKKQGSSASTSFLYSGGALVDFSSNDYMGLARCKSMRANVLSALQSDSGLEAIGSTGSRLLDGNSRTHEELEARLVRHFDAPAALLFNSGYDANSSLLSVLPQPDDFIVYDEYAHASMHDGMRASRVQHSKRLAFRHNDMADLSRKLNFIVDEISSSTVHANVFVCVEAVYSMDGDLCPLAELIGILDARLPRKQRCLIIDEAHAVGLYGKHGSGFCEQMQLTKSVDVRLATFGKAFGCSGAAVLCSPLVRLFLINYARPLVFSTAIPHTSLVAINAALDILRSAEGSVRAAHTFSLTRHFVNNLVEILKGNDQAYTPSFYGDESANLTSAPPIVPIVTRKAKDLAQHLIANGFLVRPISFPTVPQGLERVRVCIHAHNSLDQVNALTLVIKDWLARQKETVQSESESLAVDGWEKAKL